MIPIERVGRLIARDDGAVPALCRGRGTLRQIGQRVADGRTGQYRNLLLDPLEDALFALLEHAVEQRSNRSELSLIGLRCLLGVVFV